MNYRNLDQMLRMEVVIGAGLEPDQVHPSWVNPKDLGIYRWLQEHLDATLLARTGGSTLFTGEEVLQQEMSNYTTVCLPNGMFAHTTMIRHAGAVMAKRLFQQPAEILKTAKTPLRQWLQRRAIDGAKGINRREKALADIEAPPVEKVSLWQVAQEQIVRGTDLGLRLLTLLREEAAAMAKKGSWVEEYLAGFLDSLQVRDAFTKVSLTEQAASFGVSTTLLCRAQRVLRDRVEVRLRQDRTLRREIEGLYGEEFGWENV